MLAEHLQADFVHRLAIVQIRAEDRDLDDVLDRSTRFFENGPYIREYLAHLRGRVSLPTRFPSPSKETQPLTKMSEPPVT